MLLRTKILLTLTPLVILPLLGTSWIAFSKLKTTNENIIFHQMTTLLNQVESHIHSHKETTLANIELFAGSDLLRSYVFMPDYERYEVGLLPLMDLFASYNKAYPKYDEIRVLWVDGYEDVRFALDDTPNITEDESETSYFKRIQAQDPQVFAEYLLSPDTNQTILLVAKPLYFIDPSMDDATGKPERHAYLTINVNLDFIQQQIEHTNIGEDGYLFLTNADGKVVFGSKDFSKGFQLPKAVFEKIQPRTTQPIRHHVSGQTFLFQTHQVGNGFTLFAVLPEQALLKEAHSLAIIVISILIVTTIVTVALLLLVLDYLVINPLHELGKAAERIESGQFDIKLNWHRKDEICLLANQFETMASSLHESQKMRDSVQAQLEQLNQELEQRVQNRTLELESANTNLVQLNQEKNEFLGIAAHDLKNPLQAIQGSAELITMMSEDSELLEFANMIRVSSERMFDLITNLLDVNAIESGQMKITLEDVDILPTLQRVVGEYIQKAQQKNIQIHFDPKIRLYIARADESTIYQILDNLVSNAVKYSPFDKQIFVRIHCQMDKVRVEIQDQGQGLSQEDQAKLFGKFKRLSTKPTGNEHSTGLGLFIVKKLVIALGGQVWCESEFGKGACFIMELKAAT